ncbi:kinetochore protein NDC80 homolog [Ricinus communis]|uniref:Kinetochore protein NDC80 n=1 Tax=Ricinus communis TaxID=3988 RepID=B9T7Y6_RICCO|nr:kinetochore protein NDC80 homolog [Ricinus communis]EEF28028.1 hec1 protein, putative [Ricinus communis]|eukprot:XP_002534355.1 kinetochore protein NDC80 homolog [Ricinus communis]
MRGNNTRRRPTESLIPQQPPPPDHHRQFTSRDSDASFASSRPSTIGVGRSSELYTDRGHQNSAVRAINTYLSSHSSSLSLRTHPISSAKDITEVLQFLLHQLDYPTTKLEDDLFLILKFLNCPFKVSKSALRAPNTPHNWPSFLALIHWLVQIAMFEEHLAVNSRAFVENNTMLVYALDSYLSYIRGDDDSVDALDREFMEKLEKERESVVESVRVLEENFKELEAKAEGLKTGPTEREKLENLRNVLEEDVNKFNAIIAEFNSRIEGLDKVLVEKRNELETKVEERKRIDLENEDLKKRVEEQSFNARDAERMKRELQAVERNIGDAESARNSWEEKIWDLNTEIGHKYKELETLSMDCNQAVRRLKLGNGFQYLLNAKGSTPTEVMGVDYKSVVKPGLASFADDVKRSSMAKLEEFISLQQGSSEFTAKTEGKKNRIAALQSHIDEVEARLILLQNEMEEYTKRCAVEAQKLLEDVQEEAHNLGILEREAGEILKASELKLQEATKQSEEEIQKKARDLFAVVDTVSKYKEHMESKISEMKNKLSETAAAVSDAYKHFLPAQFGINLDAIIT